MRRLKWDLLGAVLLHAVVDVAESSSGQNIGGLLVDQGIKVSLNLENVGERVAKWSPGLYCELMVLMVNGKIDDKTSTEPLVGLSYKADAKNTGVDGTFEQQHVNRCTLHEASN